MALTVLPVEQHLEAVGLIVIEGLSDFVYGPLIRQLPVHKTGRETSNGTSHPTDY